MKTKITLSLLATLALSTTLVAQADEIRGCATKDIVNASLGKNGPNLGEIVGQVVVAGVLRDFLNSRSKSELKELAKYKGSRDYSANLASDLADRLEPIAGNFNTTYCAAGEKLKRMSFERPQCLEKDGGNHDAEIRTIVLRSDIQDHVPRLLIESCYGYRAHQCITIDMLNKTDDYAQLEEQYRRNVLAFADPVDKAPCLRAQVIEGAPSKEVLDRLRAAVAESKAGTRMKAD